MLPWIGVSVFTIRVVFRVFRLAGWLAGWWLAGYLVVLFYIGWGCIYIYIYIYMFINGSFNLFVELQIFLSLSVKNVTSSPDNLKFLWIHVIALSIFVQVSCI